MCALDVVNSVANLAYMEPERARQIEFNTEYFIMHSKEVRQKHQQSKLESRRA